MLLLYLDLLYYSHLTLWFISVFGGLIHPSIATFNIYIFLPLIYVSWYIFNCCILYDLKKHIIKKCKEKSIEVDEDKYIGDGYLDLLFKDTYYNPLERKEMMIIGFIVNLYILKYVWNKTL